MKRILIVEDNEKNLNLVRDILQATSLPALIDIDDGYGDVKNAVHTVQSYERMGASALMIEDQTWPKRCGHMAGKSVVPLADMAAKVRAVVGERIDPATFILARTDSRAVLGLDEALRRARTPVAGEGQVALLRTHRLTGRPRAYEPFDYLVAADEGQRPDEPLTALHRANQDPHRDGKDGW